MDIRRVEAFEMTADIAMRKGAVPAGEPRGLTSGESSLILGPSIERPKA